MKIYKIAQSKIIIPPEFGESSIPNNYIVERKDTIQEVLNGELDNITEDKFPSEYKAIQAIKINYANQA